jgi:hypothetical protein
MHLSNHIHAVKGIYMSLITLQLHPRPANHVNGHACSIVAISIKYKRCKKEKRKKTLVLEEMDLKTKPHENWHTMH